MATVESGQLNFNLIGEQAQTYLFKPVFFDGSLTDIFDMMVLVNNKQKIGYVGAMDNLLQKNAGCGWNPKGSLSIFERCVNVNEVKINNELCYDEFRNTLMKQLLKAGTQSYNLEGTAIMDILMTRVQQGLRKQLMNLAFFGDEASIDDDINLVDGMWTVYIPDLVLNNLVPYVNSNSGVPLSAGDGIDLLTAVWENASNVLKATPEAQKVFLVSTNVYFQYLKDLENNGTSSAAHLQLLQNGQTILTFRGIEVKPMYDWASLAQSYQGISDANYVLYTERENMVMATDVNNPINQFEVWTEKREETLNIKSKFYLGFNYKHEEFFSVAF
jgi:hypothetical protein